MALSDYQIALANFNAAMNADPIMRALYEERRAWGDIMLEYDQRTNPSPVRETMDQFTARLAVAPTPPAGEPQTFRTWNAQQPQRQHQRLVVKRIQAAQLQQPPPGDGRADRQRQRWERLAPRGSPCHNHHARLLLVVVVAVVQQPPAGHARVAAARLH